MSEEALDLIRPPGFNPKFRRRRKSEGEAVLEALAPSDRLAELERAKRERHVFCRHCRHYVPWEQTYATYERRNEDLWRVWWHRDCDTMLQEHNVTDMQIVQEQRDEPEKD